MLLSIHAEMIGCSRIPGRYLNLNPLMWLGWIVRSRHLDKQWLLNLVVHLICNHHDYSPFDIRAELVIISRSLAFAGCACSLYLRCPVCSFPTLLALHSHNILVRSLLSLVMHSRHYPDLFVSSRINICLLCRIERSRYVPMYILKSCGRWRWSRAWGCSHVELWGCVPPWIDRVWNR